MKDIAGLLDKGMMTTKWKSASCDFEVSKQEGIGRGRDKVMESTQAQGSECSIAMRYSL